jgi:uncharacterized 2Fe-2S/4Fe-4S cluster protein (DUF4445 family)
VLGSIKIDVPLSSLISEQRLLVSSNLNSSAADTPPRDRVLQPYHIPVPQPSLDDPRSDLERVLAALPAVHPTVGLSAVPGAVRSLPGLLRQHDWQVQALVRGGVVAAFTAPDARPIGLAVDLGTTKLAAYLVDMLTGEVLASDGRPNPQIGYGEDVVSRLVYAVNGGPQGAKTLAHAVTNTLADLSRELAARISLTSQDILECCIVGNTAMLHILLELPVGQLASAPYIPATSLPLEILAADLNLPFAGDARVYIPACVAGYVGADLVAMTYAAGIGKDNRTVLGIDIGTNTEIVLSTGNHNGNPRMLSLSCASGPAFEGAHIKAGMRAAAGAIEMIRLGLDENWIKTIDDTPPVGICGSGIIDAIAEMRRMGVLNARGRLQPGLPGVRENAGKLEYLLVRGGETGTGEDIPITQNDVDEILLAKGAIKAGITVLLEVSGLKLDDLDEVLLAGAFGSYLNLDTAIAMGLLPNISVKKYKQVGNAAGDGARQMLISSASRAESAALARQIEYIELASYPAFRRIYARSMSLDEVSPPASAP